MQQAARAGQRPYVGIKYGLTWLAARLALLTLEARVGLGANAGNVADLDVLDVLTDANNFADDLVSDNLRVIRLAPACRWRGAVVSEAVEATGPNRPLPPLRGLFVGRTTSTLRVRCMTYLRKRCASPRRRSAEIESVIGVSGLGSRPG